MQAAQRQAGMVTVDPMYFEESKANRSAYQDLEKAQAETAKLQQQLADMQTTRERRVRSSLQPQGNLFSSLGGSQRSTLG